MEELNPKGHEGLANTPQFARVNDYLKAWNTSSFIQDSIHFLPFPAALSRSLSSEFYFCNPAAGAFGRSLFKGASRNSSLSAKHSYFGETLSRGIPGAPLQSRRVRISGTASSLGLSAYSASYPYFAGWRIPAFVFPGFRIRNHATR